MTKTIEEVKAAKRELELKISLLVNEFAKEHNCGLNVDVSEFTVTTFGHKSKEYTYDCEIEIKL